MAKIDCAEKCNNKANAVVGEYEKPEFINIQQ